MGTEVQGMPESLTRWVSFPLCLWPQQTAAPQPSLAPPTPTMQKKHREKSLQDQGEHGGW